MFIRRLDKRVAYCLSLRGENESRSLECFVSCWQISWRAASLGTILTMLKGSKRFLLVMLVLSVLGLATDAMQQSFRRLLKLLRS